MYFDTHAHYDNARFNDDRHALLSELPQKDVSLVLNPGCTLKTSQKAIAYAERYPHIYAAVGCHPHNSKEMTDRDLDTFRTLCAHPKVVAVGEMGLDYHYDFSPRAVQQKRFREQLALAKEQNLPVIVHNRDATEHTLEILREFPGQTGVVHCFSGSLETANIVLDLGYYIGFTGVLTFPNARKALEIVANMPKNRLLLETDAPYMAPVPFRGKRADSSHLAQIAQVVADIWSLTAEEVAEMTMENGKRLFGISL